MSYLISITGIIIRELTITERDTKTKSCFNCGITIILNNTDNHILVSSIRGTTSNSCSNILASWRIADILINRGNLNILALELKLKSIKIRSNYIRKFVLSRNLKSNKCAHHSVLYNRTSIFLPISTTHGASSRIILKLSNRKLELVLGFCGGYFLIPTHSHSTTSKCKNYNKSQQHSKKLLQNKILQIIYIFFNFFNQIISGSKLCN